ncbi:MAG: class I SAM-dependent methyltransferase [Thermomonas sp.]|uniref:class I SAM-dependent methyltransferase n=1 Tax=Thermomonas sp. TaxID=1971895 RepID=UPI001D45E281|nr:class I SAM-dependent methyltransferase [Thermomonas sp.]MBZ0088503.1 class I SAM-dependent methyltransferase [Thermomonas sp.]
MKPIESANRGSTPGLHREVSDFWTRNVNAERIMGRTVSDGGRGSDKYFRDLEIQRYRSHRHLPSWIASMQPGLHVLEVGCGIGLDSARMVEHGLRVTAVDLTHIGAATAERRARQHGWDARYLCASGDALPFPDQAFDYVYSFGVLHHAPDTQACIDEAWRVLKPGGQALVMLYHRRSLNEWAHRLTRVPFEDRDELCPVVRRFTKAEVQQMFAKFSSVQVQSDFVFGEGYGRLFRLTPRPLYRLLSRLAGWHLMIRATR